MAVPIGTDASAALDIQVSSEYLRPNQQAFVVELMCVARMEQQTTNEDIAWAREKNQVSGIRVHAWNPE